MKTHTLRYLFGSILAIGLLAAFAVPSGFAQDAPPTPTPVLAAVPLDAAPAAAATITAGPTDVIPVAAQNMILGFFLHLAQSHPFIATLLSIIALSRTWAKPVSSLVHAVVDLTPSKSDDGWLNALLTWFGTPLGKSLAYLIDWVTSIKIVPPAKAPGVTHLT